jgi:ParB family chromosome partitioning protein
MKDAIHVRKKKDGSFHLIAGGHRMEAARRLGWDEIEAKVWTDVTDDWARLMEVDDNIAGAELNPLDTAIFLAERKAIYERLHPETKRGVAGGLARQGLASDIVSFAAATAEKFSMSRRNVERLVAAGTGLQADEIKALRSAPVQITLKDLGEISKIAPSDERQSVMFQLAIGREKSAAAARRAFKASQDGAVQPDLKDPVEAAFKAMSALWARAPMAAKRRFMQEFSDEIAALEGDGV